MNNLLSYCGFVDAKIRASDKYLPVKSDFEIEVTKRLFEKKNALQIIFCNEKNQKDSNNF